MSSQIPGGSLEDSEVLRGVMVNKDVTHPKMRRWESGERRRWGEEEGGKGGKEEQYKMLNNIGTVSNNCSSVVQTDRKPQNCSFGLFSRVQERREPG